MSEIKLVPIQKEKLRIGISARCVDVVTIVKWSKLFGDRLECRHDGNVQLIDIKDVSYYEFLDLLMDYTWAVKGQQVKLLFKHSENKYYNVLPRPLIDVFLYTEE